jgi:hypothetical protein
LAPRAWARQECDHVNSRRSAERGHPTYSPTRQLVSLFVFGKPALVRRAVIKSHEEFNFIKMTSANVTDMETRMTGSN